MLRCDADKVFAIYLYECFWTTEFYFEEIRYLSLVVYIDWTAFESFCFSLFF